LNRKVTAPGLENRDYGRGDPLHSPRGTRYPLKLALTWPTGGGRSVGIVRLLIEATEFKVHPTNTSRLCLLHISMPVFTINFKLYRDTKCRNNVI
jgi:hypothetical protein